MSANQEPTQHTQELRGRMVTISIPYGDFERVFRYLKTRRDWLWESEDEKRNESGDVVDRIMEEHFEKPLHETRIAFRESQAEKK